MNPNEFEWSSHYKRSAAERVVARLRTREKLNSRVIEQKGKFVVVAEDRDLKPGEITEG